MADQPPSGAMATPPIAAIYSGDPSTPFEVSPTTRGSIGDYEASLRRKSFEQGAQEDIAKDEYPATALATAVSSIKQHVDDVEPRERSECIVDDELGRWTTVGDVHSSDAPPMLFEGRIYVAKHDALNFTCKNQARFFYVTIAAWIERGLHVRTMRQAGGSMFHPTARLWVAPGNSRASWRDRSTLAAVTQ